MSIYIFLCNMYIYIINIYIYFVYIFIYFYIDSINIFIYNTVKLIRAEAKVNKSKGGRGREKGKTYFSDL